MGTKDGARPLFTIDAGGWLRYAPLRHHKLPTLVYANADLGDDEMDAVFVRKKRDDEVMFRRRLYRLVWDGSDSRGDDGVPSVLVQHWGGALGALARERVKSGGDDRVTIAEIVSMRDKSHVLPEALAYHLAVRGHKDVPVGNLPGPRVQQIVGAEFGIDADYHAAATYVKWLAETHWDHPLLQGFDTSVRERLLEISIEATRLYFYLLGDCIYDREAKYFARDALSSWWQELACYLFWVQRTGMGLYERHAGWPDKEPDVPAGKGGKEGYKTLWQRFREELPDVFERMQGYSRAADMGDGQGAARCAARIDGEDPARLKYMGGDLDANLLLIIKALEKIDTTGKGLTVIQILNLLYPQDKPPVGFEDARAAIEEVTKCSVGKRPDPGRLAKYLAKNRGKKVLGRSLQLGRLDHVVAWLVHVEATEGRAST